jgi:GH25 family lysozyme M1 (1,4-beta-N-acetylmuramidase)
MNILRSITFVLCAVVLTHCGVSSGGAPRGGTHIINVSAYDPKEKQRSGHSYSAEDVRALRDNGALGLIARCGKGGVLDEKCQQFLSSADRSGMMLGAYYRTIHTIDAVKQADQFINRMQEISQTKIWNRREFLLCADFDAESSVGHMTRFLDRVKQRTGIDCVIYLENSLHLRLTLRGASASAKQRFRCCPYWAALYSNDSGAGGPFASPRTPSGLAKQYDVWKNWQIWQYGGVEWSAGRSQPKVYPGFSRYFGNLDRPVERNLFRGSPEQLQQLWTRHSMKW